MRVAVVGAGVAGLCAIHQLVNEFPSAEVVAFETTDSIGGTWVYTDATGEDEFGIPIGTSMYQNLRTNLPKEVMAYSDYPIPEKYKSFLEDEEVLLYIQDYAKHFELKRYIKFRHTVTSVKRAYEGGWEVTSKNIRKDSMSSEKFDWIFICNGHYSRSYIPDFKGKGIFQGSQVHSHSYRKPEVYKDRRVLVMGAGPSGVDISIDVARVCSSLILSHRKPQPIESPFPEHYRQKSNVKEFKENSVIFEDGSQEEIDDVIYCTGYYYDCPFLDSSCNIDVQKNIIKPLYRHVVSAKHPTMFFIGLPQLTCIIPLIDMQVRYAVQIIKGSFSLPSTEEMLEHIRLEYLDRAKLGAKMQNTHMLGTEEAKYYEDIAKESGIKPTPPVFCEIRSSLMLARKNLYTYRENIYRVLDDHHYEKVENDTKNLSK